MNLSPLGHSQVTPAGRVLADTATGDGGTPRAKRFDRAQARALFAWHKCAVCGKTFRSEAGHDCHSLFLPSAGVKTCLRGNAKAE